MSGKDSIGENITFQFKLEPSPSKYKSEESPNQIITVFQIDYTVVIFRNFPAFISQKFQLYASYKTQFVSKIIQFVRNSRVKR